MKMKNSGYRHFSVFLAFITALSCKMVDGVAVRSSTTNDGELKLDPLEAIVHAGDNVNFTCSYPFNVTFNWEFSHDGLFYQITNGVNNSINGNIYWSKLTIPTVRRSMSGEITCISKTSQTSAEAFLIVNGVQIGGYCNHDNDCITDRAECLKGLCSCPLEEVLLKFTKSGYEVCRKMIYRLYDPCEFSEQCFHLVDSKSVCSNNGVCVCASWAQDVDGKCVSKSEMAYNKNQELYRVGLVAITCLIILIVAVSLWITLRRSCQVENIDTQLHSITQNDEQITDETTIEISDDKPPSYDDLESRDTVSSPPNFKDALTNSITVKKFLRQSSAPAGQLLRAAGINHRPK